MNRSYQQDNLIGQSNAFLEVLEHVSQLAPLSKPVLIIGERGTGKELVAERLHYLSQRWDQNFIKLNCSSLSENLLESELFGHEAGAFTGARARHEGRFERADSGTLFLDELANTSGLIQEKLLRVIEYGEYERVGGSKTLTADVRLICAANEDLPSLAEAGEFRADLLDRLAFDVITLPPLRYRQDDILPLAEHFALGMAKQLKLKLFPGFTNSAIHTLMNYDWPGNIRELKNTIERSVYRHGNEDKPIREIVLDPFESPFRPKQRIKTLSRQNVTPSDVAVHTVPEPPQHQSAEIPTELAVHQFEFPVDFKQSCEAFEVELIQKALVASQFNQKKTAELLQLSYHQLRGILKKYNLLDKN
ncbi:phage shock protein operon transcriptional activator [Shewanella yunxiaonensis]|uniref:Phage shock protein operon transcriptional activator n=1 Tax=Shewanella yunxiaonensis TaxID=2829809 RepID=A0ABX7YPL5_9GAMM|nr:MULTISPECIES: phage shock protein operon transcriptional activator [Shewanella]MDF0533562.1 phage shock protein operon transcriptional activator [Shewanella sp. A32]QUN04689.1 phage shock protein operon transcriptional activator [Shewanella yunxiaonensis]